MTAVWFIVPGIEERTISVEDWRKLDIDATVDITWGIYNGWSISESALTAAQLRYLAMDPEFLTGQADGPRTFPAPAPPFNSNSGPSAYAYYRELKRAFDSSDKSLFKGDQGNVGPGFAGLVPALDGTAVQGTVASTDGPVPVGDPVPVSVAWNSTVTHGTDETFARPPVTVAVIWIGSVEPLNAIDGDIWFDTAGSAPSIETTSVLLHKGAVVSKVLVATGTTPIVWSLISGALPTGIDFSSDGELSGVPATEGQEFDFTVQAWNGYGSDTQQFTGTIGVPITPTIDTPVLTGVITAGVPYSQQLVALGSTPITWSVSIGTLPNGLSLNASTGLLSGTPTVDGAYDFTVRAANSIGYDEKQYTGTIQGAAPIIQTVSLNPISQGAAYSQTISAIGSTPITWSISAGGLPTGLSLNASTGEISGTPSVAGAFNFTTRATNAYGHDDQAFSGTVASATPVITTTSFGNIYRGIAFSGGVMATGATPITFSIIAGSLPAGMSLDADTGALSGTPTTNGAYSFTVRATNSYGTNDKAFSGNVIESLPSIVETTLNTIRAGQAFSQTLTATGYSPISWSVIAGTIPDGLSINTSTGQISGTATTSGAYDFTVRATNTVGQDDQQFTGNVAGVPKFDVKGAALLSLGNQAANTPITLSINAKAGADVFIAIAHSGGAGTTSLPKCNNQNMTQFGTINMYNPTVGNAFVYRKIGGGTGNPIDVTFNTPNYSTVVNAIVWSVESVSAVSTPTTTQQNGTTQFHVGPLSCPADQIRFCIMGMANQYTGFQDPTQGTPDYQVVEHTWPGPGSVQLVVEKSTVDATTFFAGCGAGTSNFGSISFLVS